MYTEGCTIHINDITINEAVPYKISILRFGIVFAVMLGIYMVFHAKVFDQTYEKKNNKQSCILQIMQIVFIFILGVYSINASADFKISKTDGYVYNKYLVDALMNGQTYLNINPSEKLKEMENPYDYTARVRRRRGLFI